MTSSRRSIKEDQLVTWAVVFSRWAQTHFNKIIIGVAVFVVAIGGVIFMTNNRQSASAQAQRQLASALSLYQAGDYEAARTGLNTIVSNSGGRQKATATYFLAQSLSRQGNFAESLTSYEMYLKQAGAAPEFRESAIFGKALCQGALENYADASATLESLLPQLDERDPRYLDAAFLVGEFLAKAGDTKKAAEYFRTVADQGAGEQRLRAQAAAALLDS